MLILLSAQGNTTAIINELLIYLFYVIHCAVVATGCNMCGCAASHQSAQKIQAVECGADSC